MKSKIFSIAAICAALILPACNESWEPDVNPTGNGSVALRSLGVEVDNAQKVIDSRASVDVAPFIVTVRNDKNESQGEWQFSQMPEILTLPVGNYTVDVVSHHVQKAAWEQPLFKGSQSFSIEDAKITDIGTVVCKFANIKVSIRYEEELFKLLGDDVKVTVIANDEGTLVYEKNETRAGYFEAIDESTTLVAILTGQIDGYQENLRITLDDVKAGQHRIITYRIKNSNPDKPDEVGGVTPGVDIDASVITDDVNNSVPAEEEIIDGERPGDNEEKPDDPKPDDPKPENPKDISFSGDFDIDAVNTPEAGKSYKVLISSEAGVANLFVKIDSQTLTPEELENVSLKPEFDLAYPAELETALKGLGFKTGDEVIGQNEVEFDITTFVPLLSALGEGESKFIIKVVDIDGNEKSQTLTFKVD